MTKIPILFSHHMHKGSETEFHSKPSSLTSSSHKPPPPTYQNVHTRPCQVNTTILTGPLGLCNNPESHPTKQRPCPHILPNNLPKPFPSINPFSVIPHFPVPTDREGMFPPLYYHPSLSL